MKEITLVWLDHFQETFTILSQHVLGNTLCIEIERGNYRYVPLTSLREWRVS